MPLLGISYLPQYKSCTWYSTSVVLHVYWKKAAYKCPHAVETLCFQGQLYIEISLDCMW